MQRSKTSSYRDVINDCRSMITTARWPPLSQRIWSSPHSERKMWLEPGTGSLGPVLHWVLSTASCAEHRRYLCSGSSESVSASSVHVVQTSVSWTLLQISFGAVFTVACLRHNARVGCSAVRCVASGRTSSCQNGCKRHSMCDDRECAGLIAGMRTVLALQDHTALGVNL